MSAATTIICPGVMRRSRLTTAADIRAEGYSVPGSDRPSTTGQPSMRLRVTNVVAAVHT